MSHFVENSSHQRSVAAKRERMQRFIAVLHTVNNTSSAANIKALEARRGEQMAKAHNR